MTIQRLQDEYLEHEHDVERWCAEASAVLFETYLFEFDAKRFPRDHCLEFREKTGYRVDFAKMLLRHEVGEIGLTAITT